LQRNESTGFDAASSRGANPVTSVLLPAIAEKNCQHFAFGGE